MVRTARGKFEGGDAAWEEERLGSYSHSEVRLVEIQEKLCSIVERGKDQVSMRGDVDWPGIKPWPPFESLVTTCQICDTGK
jgi:hypothetical protein